LMPSYTLDIFGVLIASQLVSTVWSFGGTLIMLCIPGYLMYRFGGWIL
jgi:hypothetical protein